MKKVLLLAVLALGILGAAIVPVTAAALTDDQQNALTMLLRSFGADDSTIHDFQGAVLGATTGPTDDYGSDGSTASGTYCPKLSTTMQRGARDAATGGQVTELQLFLSDYFNLNEEDIATGFFGRLTQSYVVKFQQEKGLPTFGIVGSLTRAAIARACGGTTTTGGTTPLPDGGTPSTPTTTNVPGTTVGTGGTDANGLSYSLVLKGGSVSAEPSFIEGMEIGPFVLLVKNNSLLTQTVTFPNNCWYSYRISDRGNGGRVVFDLASIQQCISAESATSKTITLKPGDSFFIDVTHKFQTYHLPPGDYGMALLLNTRSGSDTVAKLNFKVWGREPSTSKLSCSLTSDKSSYVLGENITVRWTSSGAAYGTWYRDTEKDNFFLGGDKLAVSGAATFSANVLGNPYLLMKVFDASGNTATCRLVIPVSSQTQLPVPTTNAFDSASLIASTGNPTVTGSAIVAPVCIAINTPLGVYTSGPVYISGNRWTYTFSPSTPIPNGQYPITLNQCQYGWNLASATITINSASTVPSASLKVTAPNGGEQWEIGQLNTITWAPYSYGSSNQADWVNPANQVQVWLQKPDGTTVGQVMDTGKASLHTYFNINNYQTFASPGEYYVYAKNSTTGESDRSDRTFTLLPRAVDIQVNGSDGPLTLVDNQYVSVTFKISPNAGFTSCSLSGMRETANGVNGVQFGSAQRPIGSTFNGYAYLPFSPGSGTAIYVTCTKADGSTRGDSVQVNIGGSTSSVQINSPNGGEVLAINQPYNITWSHLGLQSVSLALYKNDQWMKWITKDYVSGDGKQLYQWTPSGVESEAAPLGQVFKIYATGMKKDGTGYVDDKSDAPFSFLASTQQASVTFDSGTFTTGTPVITGSASGVTVFGISVDNGEKVYGSGNTIQVSGGRWSHQITTPLANGTYNVKAYDANSVLIGSGTFTVSAGSSTGVLHAVGVYEAQGAQHNFCYSKPGTVTVNLTQNYKSSAPVTLSLSAYEPVIWNINVPAGVNLQKVILSGYNVQSPVITGASPLVERYFYSDPANAARGSSASGAFYDDRDGADSRYQTIYHWAGQTMCAATSGAVPVANRWYYNPGSNYFYAYQQGDSNYTNLAAKLQSLTGLPIKSFTGAYSGSVFTVPVGGEIPPIIDYFGSPLP